MQGLSVALPPSRPARDGTKAQAAGLQKGGAPYEQPVISSERACCGCTVALPARQHLSSMAPVLLPGEGMHPTQPLCARLHVRLLAASFKVASESGSALVQRGRQGGSSGDEQGIGSRRAVWTAAGQGGAAAVRKKESRELCKGSGVHALKAGCMPALASCEDVLHRSRASYCQRYPSASCWKGLAISSVPAVGTTSMTLVPRQTIRPSERVASVNRIGSSGSAGKERRGRVGRAGKAV